MWTAVRRLERLIMTTECPRVGKRDNIKAGLILINWTDKVQLV